MEQTDQLQQAPVQAPASQEGVQAGALTGLRNRFLPHLIRRYRVFVAGILAIVMALAGEILMRSPASGYASNSPVSSGPSLTWLGSLLVALAALLVGLVAWVNDTFRTGSARNGIAAPDGESGVRAPLPTRAVRAQARQSVVPESSSTPSLPRLLRAMALRYSAARAKLGWYGTGAGVLVASALGVWLALILRADWRDPLAGWVWLAIMLVLLLTFAGVRAWPAGPGLIAHDPAEPAFEPPMVRAEWIALGVIMVAAVVLRFWHLDSIPAGPYIDEAGRSLDARNLNYGLPGEPRDFRLLRDRVVGRAQLLFLAGGAVAEGVWGQPAWRSRRARIGRCRHGLVHLPNRAE